MYKIFINQIPVYLMFKHGTQQLDDLNDDGVMISDDTGKKSILSLIDQLNASLSLNAVYLLSKNPKGLLARIKSFYKLVEAAGGLVYNKNNDLLMIFRRGVWDLPKGKIEQGESKRRAAIREVKEETGIKKLNVIQSLKLYPAKQTCSYHTYVENNTAMIKATYWFLMRSKSTDELVPQLEEDIVQAEWVSTDNLNEFMQKTFGSIKDVIGAAKSKI